MVMRVVPSLLCVVVVGAAPVASDPEAGSPDAPSHGAQQEEDYLGKYVPAGDEGHAGGWHKYMGDQSNKEQGDYTKYMGKYGGSHSSKYLEKYAGGQANYQKYVDRYSSMAGGHPSSGGSWAGKEASQKAAFKDAMQQTYSQYIPGSYSHFAESGTASRGNGQAGGAGDYQKYMGEYQNKGGSGSGGGDYQKYYEKFMGQKKGSGGGGDYKKYYQKYMDHNNNVNGTASGGDYQKQYEQYMAKYGKAGSSSTDWHKYADHHGEHSSGSGGSDAPAREPVSFGGIGRGGDQGGGADYKQYVEKYWGKYSKEQGDDHQSKESGWKKYVQKYANQHVGKPDSQEVSAHVGTPAISLDAFEDDDAAVASAASGDTEQTHVQSNKETHEDSALRNINKYAAKFMPKDVLQKVRHDVTKRAHGYKSSNEATAATPKDASQEERLAAAPVFVAVENEAEVASGDVEETDQTKEQMKELADHAAALHDINKYAAKYMPHDVLRKVREDLTTRPEGADGSHSTADVPRSEDVARPPVFAAIDGAGADASEGGVVDDGESVAADAKVDEKAQAKAKDAEKTLKAINKYAAPYMPKDVLEKLVADLKQKAGEVADLKHKAGDETTGEDGTDNTEGEVARPALLDGADAAAASAGEELADGQVAGTDAEHALRQEEAKIIAIEKFAGKYMAKDVEHKIIDHMENDAHKKEERLAGDTDAQPGSDSAPAEESETREIPNPALLLDATQEDSKVEEEGAIKSEESQIHNIEKYAGQYMPKDVEKKLVGNMEDKVTKMEQDVVSDDDGDAEPDHDADKDPVLLLSAPEPSDSVPLVPFVLAIGMASVLAAASFGRRRERDDAMYLESEAPFQMMP